MERYRLKATSWLVVRDSALRPDLRLDSPAAAAAIVADIIRTSADDDREHLLVIMTDSKLRYRCHAEVSVGTQTATLAHPREIFGPAIRSGAVNIILAHNHPSGDPSPSHEDISLTRRVMEAGKILEIPVLDHIIVGNGTWSWKSLKENGYM